MTEDSKKTCFKLKKNTLFYINSCFRKNIIKKIIIILKREKKILEIFFFFIYYLIFLLKIHSK